MRNLKQMGKSAKAKIVVVGATIVMGATNAMAALSDDAQLALATEIESSTTAAVALGVLTLTAVITFWGLKAAKRAL